VVAVNSGHLLDDVFRNININYFSCTAPYNQEGARIALESPLAKESIQRMVSIFQERRDLVVNGLNAIKGIRCQKPKGAFYAFPNITGLLGRSFNGKLLKTSSDMAAFLLDEVKVALVPGSAFGAEGYLRLSYATSQEKIKEGIDRIEKALGMLEVC